MKKMMSLTTITYNKTNSANNNNDIILITECGVERWQRFKAKFEWRGIATINIKGGGEGYFTWIGSATRCKMARPAWWQNCPHIFTTSATPRNIWASATMYPYKVVSYWMLWRLKAARYGEIDWDQLVFGCVGRYPDCNTFRFWKLSCKDK